MKTLENNWWVYTLYSSNFKRIYIGMSQNPEQRLIEHHSGKTKSTKAYTPWKLIYTEFVGSRLLARLKEKELKTTNGRRFIRNLLKEE